MALSINLAELLDRLTGVASVKEQLRVTSERVDELIRALEAMDADMADLSRRLLLVEAYLVQHGWKPPPLPRNRR